LRGQLITVRPKNVLQNKGFYFYGFRVTSLNTYSFFTKSDFSDLSFSEFKVIITGEDSYVLKTDFQTKVTRILE
jgi:hypothetical protein